MNKTILILLCSFISICIFADEKIVQNKLPEDVLIVLEKADKLELLSLDPNRIEDKDKSKEGFHGFQILGKIEVKEEVRKKIVSSLLAGIASEKNMAKCFEPRHGIHAVHDGKTVDLVICFQCQRVDVYAVSATKINFLAISSTPEPVFDKVLNEAGITKAK